jgi:endonuclease/exonuclease/phosphatase (EEP) superfamily protein YafD
MSSLEKPERKTHLEDLALDKEILQLILKKLSENVWNRLVWLRMWLEFVKVINNLRIPTNEGNCFLRGDFNSFPWRSAYHMVTG